MPRQHILKHFLKRKDHFFICSVMNSSTHIN